MPRVLALLLCAILALSFGVTGTIFAASGAAVVATGDNVVCVSSDGSVRLCTAVPYAAEYGLWLEDSEGRNIPMSFVPGTDTEWIRERLNGGVKGANAELTPETLFYGARLVAVSGDEALVYTNNVSFALIVSLTDGKVRVITDSYRDQTASDRGGFLMVSFDYPDAAVRICADPEKDEMVSYAGIISEGYRLIKASDTCLIAREDKVDIKGNAWEIIRLKDGKAETAKPGRLRFDRCPDTVLTDSLTGDIMLYNKNYAMRMSPILWESESAEPVILTFDKKGSPVKYSLGECTDADGFMTAPEDGHGYVFIGWDSRGRLIAVDVYDNSLSALSGGLTSARKLLDWDDITAAGKDVNIPGALSFFAGSVMSADRIFCGYAMPVYVQLGD